MVWSTYSRAPWITPQIEPIVLDTIKRKSAELPSPIAAINCVEDHIHVAVSIASSVAVAEWVKQVKGLSAHEVNRVFPSLEAVFRWQNGYGVLTFGAKNLPFVVQYIEQQKTHHTSQTYDNYLEHMED